jgi:hypothetical protein
MHISIDTVLPADSVEFCPHPDASNIFVCGTYKLEDKQNDQGVSQPPAGQIRKGQCLVFEVHSEHSEDISVYAVVFASKAVIEVASAPRLRIYPSLLSWTLNGETICLFPGRVEGWSSSQVSHQAESPAVASSGGCGGQYKFIRVESPASFVLTALWVESPLLLFGMIETIVQCWLSACCPIARPVSVSRLVQQKAANQVRSMSLLLLLLVIEAYGTVPRALWSCRSLMAGSRYSNQTKPANSQSRMLGLHILTNRGVSPGIIGIPISFIPVRAYLTLSVLTTTDLLPPGGDDLRLKVWDIRQGFDQPIIANKRCAA